MSKYNNKAIYYDPETKTAFTKQDLIYDERSKNKDLVRFASVHEYRVYCLLTEIPDCRIYPQSAVQIIPPKMTDVYPHGRSWRVDFLLRDSKNRVYLVEAKGTITVEFPFIVSLLQIFNEELYQNLWLVFPRKVPNLRTLLPLKLSSMANRIVCLKELRNKIRTTSTLLL